jgi:hypothetical protein
MRTLHKSISQVFCAENLLQAARGRTQAQTRVTSLDLKEKTKARKLRVFTRTGSLPNYIGFG